MLSEQLIQWVIYAHPKDYPNKFVVRRWIMENRQVCADATCILADTLEEARRHVPSGFINFGRFDGDDPVICEVWL